jgi:hypothetical protein
MRIPFVPLSVSAAVLPALFAVAAHAQPVPAPPDDDPCADFRGFGAPPPVPPDGDAIAEPPGTGNLFLTSPPSGAFDVPRNVEVRLGGDVNALDVEPAQMAVQLLDQSGARVPYERTGLTLRPLAPLAAAQTFFVRIEPTDANQCPDCFGIQETQFTTGDLIDRTAPVLEGPPPVHVFVLPNGEQAEQCGVFFGQTHIIVVDMGPQLPNNTWIEVAGKKEGAPPQGLFEQFNTSGQVFAAQTNVGTTVPTALGDVFFVAITPRDLAGNVGAARVVRVRARSFTDQQLPREELIPLWCDMPESPHVVAAETLPTNGELAVEFPFEEVPVALQSVANPDAPVIPLVPVRDTATGNVYNTVVPLPAGEQFDVVGLECTQCVCKGCTRFAPQRVVVGAGEDNEPPAAPAFVELREDPSPPLSVAGQCVPDRPAILAILEAGVDNATAAVDMRYDATIAIDGQPPVVLGRSLSARDIGSGQVEVRIETNGFGRVLGEPLELTLEAIDAAGNRAAATHAQGQEEDTGCASTSPAQSLLGALALALLALRRRVGRASVPAV